MSDTSSLTTDHAKLGVLGRHAGRDDKGKSLMHTMDPDFIAGIGRISAFGAKKYHQRNFLMAPGMAWGKVYDSLLRHLFAWWGGEELDIGPNGEFGETDDPATNMQWSGMPHLLHVAWNVMVLYTYSRHEPYEAGDDRPGKIEYKDRDWKTWASEFEHQRAETEERTHPRVDLAAEIEKLNLPRHSGHPGVDAIRKRMGLKPLAEALRDGDLSVNDARKAYDSYEGRLAFALLELEELGFKRDEDTGAMRNEHGESAHTVLADYTQFGEETRGTHANLRTPFEDTRRVRTEPRNPDFLKDPIRAYYEHKNKGEV